MSCGIPMMLCCNDESGNFSGQVCKIDFDELGLEIELDKFPDGGIPMIWRMPSSKTEGKGGPWIGIGGFREITTYSYRHHVGNIFWDCATVLPPEAAELINFLASKDLAHCTTGPCEIFDKINSKIPITAHDLDEKWVTS